MLRNTLSWLTFPPKSVIILMFAGFLRNTYLKPRIRINHQITAKELRVVDEEEGNLGVISLSEALARAEEKGVDLIEISPMAVPPVAKLMDFGKWQYQQNKKEKIA